MPKTEDSTIPKPALEGEARDASRFAETIYPDLKRIARARMRHERPDHTLQPTALVNELYLHLLQNPDLNWADREHFLLSASRAMHNLLIDHARARGTLKRGGGWARVDLDEPGESAAGFDMLELAELLSVLEAKEPRMADVVRLKFYVGLSVAEIGEALGIDERSVKRDWALARQWLRGHLENQ